MIMKSSGESTCELGMHMLNHAQRDNFLNDSLMFKVSCTRCVMIKWITCKLLAGRLDFLKPVSSKRIFKDGSILKFASEWTNSLCCLQMWTQTPWKTVVAPIRQLPWLIVAKIHVETLAKTHGK